MYIYPHYTDKTDVIFVLSHIWNSYTGKIILMFRHYSDIISTAWRLNTLTTRLFDELIV